MLIAVQKRKENIVEYILYMWQIEDILRSCYFDIRLIKKHIISKYEVDSEIQIYIMGWYDKLITQIKSEKIEEKGHLSNLNQLIEELNYLHKDLIANKNETYTTLYDSAKLNIDDLRRKSIASLNDIEICLNGLYGTLLLKLKKREISKETSLAIETISKLMAYLAKEHKTLYPVEESKA